MHANRMHWIDEEYSILVTREGSWKAFINPRPYKNVSSLFLKLLMESHATIPSLKLFHISTTLCAKENFRTSNRQLGLTIFKEWPPVDAVLSWKNVDGSTFSNPLIIVNTSIRSPLSLLVFRVGRFKQRNLSS